MDLLDHLKQSLEDDHLSKSEKNDLRLILGNQTLDSETVNFLRSKIYELANAKATSSNFQFVMQWMKDANNILSVKPAEQSEVFFSPGETCRRAIIHQMDSARHTLKICVFTISDDLITRAIIHAHRRGVAVSIITDNDKSHDHGSDVEQLAGEGIPVRMDISSNHMHHKFMIADDRSLVTGSYNWTSSAARFNYENILVTKESGVIKSFQKEFERLWNAPEIQ